MSSICVIGGTRFFGKRVVRGLIAQGHEVTVLTRGRAGDDFGDTVQRLQADANDVQQLRAAIDGRAFDVVLHQMCYSPIAATAAGQAFAGRARRMVMTSTIEVYNPDTFAPRTAPDFSPLARERELDPHAYGFDTGLPWLDPAYADKHYGEGKRQAEAALAQLAPFPVAFARVGHVLSDQDEFTGRFRFHVERILQGAPIRSWPSPGRTSFVHADDIAAFLVWAAQTEVTGAINACAPESLSVRDLCAAIAAAAGRPAWIEEVADPRGDDALSPFSCPRDFAMSTARANELGYHFTSAAEWLPRISAKMIAANTVAATRSACSI